MKGEQFTLPQAQGDADGEERVQAVIDGHGQESARFLSRPRSYLDALD
jgi:hypothetical protein